MGCLSILTPKVEPTNCAKPEQAKELVGAVIIFEGIASYTEVDEARAGKERGEIHDGKDSVQRSGSRKYMRERRVIAGSTESVLETIERHRNCGHVDRYKSQTHGNGKGWADGLAIASPGSICILQPVIRQAWTQWLDGNILRSNQTPTPLREGC